MNAAEIATVVEGWATLVGLMVVVAGAVFAGVQLRREAKARRLQAMVNLFADILPPEFGVAATIVQSLPDDFVQAALSDQQYDALRRVTSSYNRLGYILCHSAL